jgi:hypothetical protein
LLGIERSGQIGGENSGPLVERHHGVIRKGRATGYQGGSLGHGCGQLRGKPQGRI